MISTGEEFALRAVEKEARAYLDALKTTFTPDTSKLLAALDWVEEERKHG